MIALALATLLVAASPAANASPFTAPTVAVEGTQFTEHDILEMTVLVIDGGAFFRHPIKKAPNEMPDGHKYAYYAGKDGRGLPIIWLSSRSDDKGNAAREESNREEEGVAILAVLDSGIDPNPIPDERKAIIEKLQPLYSAVAGDPARVNRLGVELADSMKKMSNLLVARSAAVQAWIFTAFTTSMTRAQVYDQLHSRNLEATTQDKHTDFPPNGPAIITLDGPFEPGCYTSNSIVITFNDQDNFKQVAWGQPTSSCL